MTILRFVMKRLRAVVGSLGIWALPGVFQSGSGFANEWNRGVNMVVRCVWINLVIVVFLVACSSPSDQDLGGSTTDPIQVYDGTWLQSYNKLEMQTLLQDVFKLSTGATFQLLNQADPLIWNEHSPARQLHSMGVISQACAATPVSALKSGDLAQLSKIFFDHGLSSTEKNFLEEVVNSFPPSKRNHTACVLIAAAPKATSHFFDQGSEQ